MRLVYVDALRGLAAIGVAYFHITQYLVDVGKLSRDVPIPSFVLDVDLGRVGVIAFFIVSGFVIPKTIRSLDGFARSRFMRLYPAYWVSVIFAALVWGADPQTLISNLTMLQGFVGVADLNLVYWTLQVELMFYALCAGLFAAGLLSNPFAIVAAAIASAILWNSGFFTGWLVFTFLGTLLRLVLHERDIPWLKPLAWLGTISYSIYLLHLPILGALHALKRYPAFYTATELLTPMMQEMVFLALVIVVSWASFLWIEKPLMRSGRSHGALSVELASAK